MQYKRAGIAAINLDMAQWPHIGPVNRIHGRIDHTLKGEFNVIGCHFAVTVAEHLARFQAEPVMRTIDLFKRLGCIELCIPGSIGSELQQVLVDRGGNDTVGGRERAH